MATWYAANSYSVEIEEREITRHTAQTVFFMQYGKERSERIASSYNRWFQSKAAAAQWLLDTFNAKAASHQKQVDSYRGKAHAVHQKYASELAQAARGES